MPVWGPEFYRAVYLLNTVGNGVDSEEYHRHGCRFSSSCSQASRSPRATSRCPWIASSRSVPPPAMLPSQKLGCTALAALPHFLSAWCGQLPLRHALPVDLGSTPAAALSGVTCAILGKLSLGLLELHGALTCQAAPAGAKRDWLH